MKMLVYRIVLNFLTLGFFAVRKISRVMSSPDYDRIPLKEQLLHLLLIVPIFGIIYLAGEVVMGLFVWPKFSDTPGSWQDYNFFFSAIEIFVICFCLSHLFSVLLTSQLVSVLPPSPLRSRVKLIASGLYAAELKPTFDDSKSSEDTMQVSTD